MKKSLCEIIKENEDNINFENVCKMLKHVDHFIYKNKNILKEEDYDVLINNIENELQPFLNEEKAKYYVSQIINNDGTKGPHFTMEQVSGTLMTKHIETETENYNFYDLYVQINLIYSDLGPILNFDTDKIIASALAYLNDKDFPGKGEISYTKWYCEAKEELKDEEDCE